MEMEYGKCGSGMPDLSVVKVSRRSGKGQMENGGKRKGKMNGADRKSGWIESCAETGQRERRDAGSGRENFPNNCVYSKFGMAGRLHWRM
ncbi:MAG: hypothetical protein WAM58_24655 [Candidatus Acidiferrum sp.]